MKAIDDIRKTKQEQRRMVDSQVTVLEVYKNQAFITDSMESMVCKQDDLEKAVSTLHGEVRYEFSDR